MDTLVKAAETILCENRSVADEAERSVLLTLRARIDPAFRDVVFVSLRQYRPRDGADVDEAAEAGGVDDALAVLRGWLEAFAAEGLR